MKPGVPEVQPVVGIIGHPLGHTLSPRMHNAAFAALGMDWRYIPIQVEPEEVEDLLRALKVSNFRGLNVTMPYKSKVIGMLDDVDELALACGAVNTISFVDGVAHGYNTDCTGFLRSVATEADITLAGKKVVLLGAGGVARAVAVALARSGVAEVMVWGRTPTRADDLISSLGALYPQTTWGVLAREQSEALEESCIHADIVINGTPVGMFPHVEEAPIPTEWLHDAQLVADLIYRPATTRLLTQAESRGAAILRGVGTFLRQAEEAFSIWTGMAAPTGSMQRVLQDELGYTPHS